MNWKYDVSIIVVNYNGLGYIDALMEGLSNLRHDDFSFEVVFVDNCSADNSVEYICARNKEINLDLRVIESKKNLGFAGGNNLGVKNARGNFIVLLNNDTKPNSDWLNKLYHFILTRDDVVMVNSKMVFFYDFIEFHFETKDQIRIKRNVLINGVEYRIDAKFCKNAILEEYDVICFGHTRICFPILKPDEDFVMELSVDKCSAEDLMIASEKKSPLHTGINKIDMSNQYVIGIKKTLIQNAGSGINDNYDGYDIGFCEEDGPQYCCDYEIGNGCGAGVIFRKRDFDQVGGFDERFFMYYEDTDLSYRLKRFSGKKIMYCHEAVVRHVHAGSSGEWSPFFTYHVFRNKLFFLKNNFDMLVYLKYFFKQLLQGIKSRDKAKIKGTLDSLK